MLIKAFLRDRFSLVVFGGSQVVMDIQPVVFVLTGIGSLHGFSHTYLAAAFIGLFCALSGKYLGEMFLRRIRWADFRPIRWPVAFISAFIGTYSHVFIDDIMHADVHPLLPFSRYSPAYGLMNMGALHLFCVLCFIMGLVLYFAVADRPMRKKG